jgi:hypothetical protein
MTKLEQVVSSNSPTNPILAFVDGSKNKEGGGVFLRNKEGIAISASFCFLKDDDLERFLSCIGLNTPDAFKEYKEKLNQNTCNQVNEMASLAFLLYALRENAVHVEIYQDFINIAFRIRRFLLVKILNLKEFENNYVKKKWGKISTDDQRNAIIGCNNIISIEDNLIKHCSTKPPEIGEKCESISRKLVEVIINSACKINENGGSVSHFWIPSVHKDTPANRETFLNELKNKNVQWRKGKPHEMLFDIYLDGNINADRQAKLKEFNTLEPYGR